MSMKPYLVIEGSDKSLEAFEQKVASALEKGYVLGGELVVHGNSPAEVKFYQTMVLDEDAFDDEEDEEDDEEEEEDEDD